MNDTTRALNPGVLPANTEPPAPQRTNRGNTGKAFEKEIEVTAGAYQSRRTATLRKVDPPVAIIWPFNPKTGKKEQRVIFKKSIWTDFAGCWTARHGRALFIECKSTSTHRLRVGGDSGGVTSEQVGALRTWRMSGAAVCVLWQFNGSVTLWIPEVISECLARGDKSVTFESGIPVPRGEGSLIWDFLPVLEETLWPKQAGE